MPYYEGHYWIHQGAGKYIEYVKAIPDCPTAPEAIARAVEVGELLEKEKNEGPVTDYKIMRGKKTVLSVRTFPREGD